MIRAIAFDWGGIFTEGTFDGRAIQALAAAGDVPPERVEAAYLPLMAEFEVGAFDMATFHRRLTEAAGLDLDLATFRETFLGSVQERIAMFSVLGGIPTSYRVGMLSNNVPELCDRVRDDPRMRRFESFVFSNEIGVRKPDPDAFAALSDALGVAPHETVFVDDSAANVDACRALGFHGIHFADLDDFVVQWRAVVPDVPTGLETT
ncbi:MAG: HAD family phosphatase [Trueperaceae bacterium]|nr:HAD family phosphatase [Trueperaceae bacterium]